jgi:hypothetical protein
MANGFAGLNSMTEHSTKRPPAERTPEKKRRWLVDGNSAALETAIASAIANGEKPDGTVVLLLDLRDEWGGLLAKLFNPEKYDEALRAAPLNTAPCFVTSKDRRALAKLFTNISPELGNAVAAPPPDASFSVLCVADGFEVFSGPLPLTGRKGDA